MSSLASDVTGPFAGLFFIALTLCLALSVICCSFVCAYMGGQGQRYVGLKVLEVFFLPYFLYFFAIGSKNLGFRLAARLALEPAGQPI